MKTLTEIRTALNYEFDVFYFGGTVRPCDPSDKKAKFLTSGHKYPKVIKDCIAISASKAVGLGAIVPPIRYHVEVKVNRLGLPQYFYVYPTNVVL